MTLTSHTQTAPLTQPAPHTQIAPAAFVGHGSPMNTLERNRFTSAWRQFGIACGTPRAILVVSAHWYTNATAVTAMTRPRTIHDFYGFPRELFAFHYPAPGSRGLAEEVADLARPDVVGLDSESWGLDHGAWSVLAHAFPRAEIPVVQLAINALQPFSYHVELAERLAPLRERGVVIIGSGNLVHNLHRISWNDPDGGYPWAERFDALVQQRMVAEPASVAALDGHEDFRMIAPTPEHFVPLLYIAGLAHASGRPPQVLVQGCAYGSISMTCFALDLPTEGQAWQGTAAQTPAAPPPAPHLTPPDQTNL